MGLTTALHTLNQPFHAIQYYTDNSSFSVLELLHFMFKFKDSDVFWKILKEKNR